VYIRVILSSAVYMYMMSYVFTSKLLYGLSILENVVSLMVEALCYKLEGLSPDEVIERFELT
jgi:hypothetical protein